MTIEEIQLVWNSLLGAGAGLAVAAVVAAVLVRSFLSSYLDAKGKSLATKEDVQLVLEQLQKVETLKADIAQMSWLRQQQWVTREKHYLSLLASLTKFTMSLLDRLDYFLQAGSEHDTEIGNNERFKELQTTGWEALRSIREQVGPASIFLSEAAIDTLNTLIDHHWSVAEFSDCRKAYLSNALGLSQSAYATVLAEARIELAHAETGT